MPMSSQEVKAVAVPVPVYGLESVYQACYAFLDRAYIRLEGDPQVEVKVIIRAKDDASPDFAKNIEGEFGNELLHQALRQKVASANQKIREYIITRALASAEGVAPSGGVPATPDQKEPILDAEIEKEIEKLLAEVEKEGAEGDPLNIVVPWEEKNGSAGKVAPSKKKGARKK